MKKLLAPFVALCACLSAWGQPAPTFEASSAQTAAGTAGAPFYISPRRLGGFGFVATNLPLSTATNIAQGVADTTSNALIITTWGSYTNVVVFSNGPPVAGQAFVIVGTNDNGSVIVKGTNWPTGGGGGSGSLFPPSALGVLTNTAGGVSNWSTSFTGTWITDATLPISKADTSWMPVTNAVAITNQPTTIGQALVVVGTNVNGATMVKGTNWPTQSALTDGVNITNLLHSATVSAGANTTVTPSQNPDGSTNYAVAATGGGGGSGIPWAPITFGWASQTLSAGEERYTTERGVDPGSTTSLGNLVVCPIGIRSRILTNVVIMVASDGTGDPVGAGTNVTVRVYTNNVYSGFSVRLQGNGSGTFTNSLTSSVTLSGGRLNYWAVGVSNENSVLPITSGGFTFHAECITQ